MTTKKSKLEVRNTYVWMSIFSVMTLLFVLGTIVITVISIQEEEHMLPKTVDAVILEDSENPPTADRNMTKTGSVRGNKQVSTGDKLSTIHAILISRNMKFVRNIYILTTQLGIDGSALEETGLSNCYYVNVPPETRDGGVDAYFMAMKDIKNKTDVPDIASHAIFLSNRTVPMRNLEKTHLFYRDRPRMINIFREASELDLLGNFFENTAPSFVVNVDMLSSPFVDEDSKGDSSIAVRDVVFLSITEERGTLRNDINRDVLLYGMQSARDNHIKQAEELEASTPVFATFHIRGPNIEIAKTFMKEYLVCKTNNTFEKCIFK
jgi:hypothetical protein